MDCWSFRIYAISVIARCRGPPRRPTARVMAYTEITYVIYPIIQRGIVAENITPLALYRESTVNAGE